MIFANIYRGKRVFVTGHTGFKGSWLCQWLLDLGAEVAGYSIDLPSNPSHFEALGLGSLLKKHTLGDIRDLAKLQAAMQAFQPEFVFHLAAQPLVRLSYDDPKGTFDTNVGGTINVMEAIRATPSVRSAVMIATDKCYENFEWEFGYRENDRLGGKDPYSASKACAEIAFISYFKSFFHLAPHLKIASARAGNVIGGGDWAADRIVPDLTRAWSRGESAVVRSPKSTRPWQHVLEPLSGYLWLGAKLVSEPAPQSAVNGESFNFGPGHDANQSVERLIGEMQKTWTSGRFHVDSAGIGTKKEAGLLQLNCDKAYGRLKWEPTLSFEQSVQMTASWYRAYAENSGAKLMTSAQIREYEQLAREKRVAWSE